MTMKTIIIAARHIHAQWIAERKEIRSGDWAFAADEMRLHGLPPNTPIIIATSSTRPYDRSYHVRDAEAFARERFRNITEFDMDGGLL